jgi:hypothetical protein
VKWNDREGIAGAEDDNGHGDADGDADERGGGDDTKVNLSLSRSVCSDQSGDVLTAWST